VILVDTSVWVDHLRFGDEALAGLLETGHVLVHPFVIGELALGNLRQRRVILGYLRDLPQAAVATNGEVLQFIERHELAGRGIGYVDVHLLASTRLTPGCSLWTRDKRLSAVAEQLGLASKLPSEPSGS
jgi:predicted nucleic acid-binding protein